MEKTMIATGKTIDLAIEEALTQLGLTRDDVSVQVLATPKAGFLGLGGTPAKAVAIQDPYQLARDLEETEELRTVVGAFATIDELLLNRKETVWAGNILMAQYTPNTVSLVAARRLSDVTRVGKNAIVTACVGEYAAMKAVNQNQVEVLSIEDLILG